MYIHFLLPKGFIYFSICVYLLHSSVGLEANYVPPAQNSRVQSLQQAIVNNDDRQLKQHNGFDREWIFEGLLAPDGSISTAKLMNERNPSAEELPLENRRRPISYFRSPQIPKPTHHHLYPLCPKDFRDYIPCLNASSSHLFDRECGKLQEQGLQDCVIPTPANYARQFKWPASKNQVRQPNIPDVPILRNREWQSWFQSHGSAIILGPGEPHFPNGTTHYFNDLSMKVPGLAFGERVRVVLDVGCGAGNVAVDLDMRGAITLSVPGEGSCDNGVQLILERGYPSILQALDKHRLPYPDQAFDLIHCAACEVKWELDGGLKLLEADRILRTGGFFVWIDPLEAGTRMEHLTKKMCWKLVAKEAKLFVWEKSTNESCYRHQPLQFPPICGPLSKDGNSWNIPLQRCIQGFPATGIAERMQWPARLECHLPRLKEISVAGLEQAKAEAYLADLNFWKVNIDIYIAGFGRARIKDIRNVLDMNAGYAGFATAVLLKKPALAWWVLNVVPVNMPDRLALIFDRGLVGVYHDWCESLELHPRSFDLVHASGLFSSAQRCSTKKMIQEIDRLLRPGGFALIRDTLSVLSHIQALATAFHWKAMIIDTESGPKGKNKVLSCQKSFWRLQP